MEQYNYTYSGIKRTLKYFYEVKQNPIEKANGTIGIVPWVYDEAYRYYYNQWLLQQKNTDKVIQDYTPKTVEITIKSPTKKPKRRHIFAFLDKEEKDE